MIPDSNPKRHRNVAHLWADKQVIRFFRHNFSTLHYKNLRSVYLALCEIDSDFGENIPINSFVKTVATYSGMNVDTIRPYLRAMQRIDLIDYWQERVDGVFGRTTLEMYKWDRDEDDKVAIKQMMGYLQDKTPLTGNPGNGETSPYKNGNTNVLPSDSKKSSKEDSMSILDNPITPIVRIRNKVVPVEVKQPKIPPYQSIVDNWNNTMVNTSIPCILKLSDSRKTKIRARWKDNQPLSLWTDVFQKIVNSSFLTGGSDCGWVCSFDWLIEKETNFSKVMEGNYDDKTSTKKKPVSLINYKNGITPGKYAKAQAERQRKMETAI